MNQVKTVEDLRQYELTPAGHAMIKWLNTTRADVFELDQPDYAKYLFMEALTDTFERMDKHTLQIELMNHEVGFTQLLICGLVRLKMVLIAPQLPPPEPVQDPMLDYNPRCGTCGGNLQLVEEGKYNRTQILDDDNELDGGDEEGVDLELDADYADWQCSVDPSHQDIPVMYFDDYWGWIAEREIKPVDDGVGL